jgi:hypothetical protein
MGCFQPDDASAHTSYLIMLLKSGPRAVPQADRPLYRPHPPGQRIKALFLRLLPCLPQRESGALYGPLQTRQRFSEVFYLYFPGWRNLAQIYCVTPLCMT